MREYIIYILIDNSGIREEHLWKDGIHPNNKGNTFEHTLLLSFENIWVDKLWEIGAHILTFNMMMLVIIKVIIWK